MKELLLGVGREIITPKIGARLHGYGPDIFSESVNDDLTATAFYFEQGDTKALMISTTVCSIRSDLAEMILEKIEEQYQVPKECCLLAAIHTHSGPCTNGKGRGWGDVDWEYCNSIYIPKILAAVGQALAKPQKVTVGVGIGDSLVGINRRQLTSKNETGLGQCKWGCFNPQMTVISFKNGQGEAVANMVHYGCHGTAAGKNTEISRDWPGVMIDGLEKESGAITAFFNGAEGDIGPRLSNGKTTGDISYVYEIGRIAARDAIRIYKTISDYKELELKVAFGSVRLPLAPKTSKEAAEAIYEEYKEFNSNIRKMQAQTALATIKAWEAGEQDQLHTEIDQPIIGLGDLYMVGFPFEMFSQIAMRIDEAFPDQNILTLSLTNGTEGYFITEDAICRGGYEVTYFLSGSIQPFTRDGDFHIMRKTVENIKRFKGEE